MDTTIVIILLCLLFILVIYLMHLNFNPPDNSTEVRYVVNDPYDNWFSGGYWNTGWYGPLHNGPMHGSMHGHGPMHGHSSMHGSMHGNGPMHGPMHGHRSMHGGHIGGHH